MRRNHKELLDRFPGKRVLVVGDVMLDEYLWGEVRRISPEAPVPVVEIQRRSHAGGGASNTAVNVISLGGKALLAGVVGGDASAAKLRETLCDRGVDVDGLIADPGRTTTTKTRIVAHQQQVVRVDLEHRLPLPRDIEDRILGWLGKQIGSVHACIVSDYAKGVVSPRLVESLISEARRAARPVIIDPKGIDYTKYRGATVVKPNLHEAERVCKHEIHGDADLLEVGNRLLEILEGSNVLLTRGKEGMTLFRKEAAPLHIPSVAREVFDVTGAGDTVASALAMSFAVGASAEEAADLANTAAGIVVGKVGTSSVSRDELLAECG